MYTKLPNLVFGFHGCDASTYDKVIKQEGSLNASHNDYDWLGSGVYFWEQNYKRALQWAQEQQRRALIEKPAVIGAVIDLGHCLNLTDSTYIDLLENEYRLLEAEFDLVGLPLPKNTGKTSDRLLRKLDCAVVEHLHDRIEHGDTNSIMPFDSARGLFSEGSEIYPDAGFKKKTHVQICVRNPNCIKAYFAPRKVDKDWKMP